MKPAGTRSRPHAKFSSSLMWPPSRNSNFGLGSDVCLSQALISGARPFTVRRASTLKPSVSRSLQSSVRSLAAAPLSFPSHGWINRRESSYPARSAVQRRCVWCRLVPCQSQYKAFAQKVLGCIVSPLVVRKEGHLLRLGASAAVRRSQLLAPERAYCATAAGPFKRGAHIGLPL